MASPEAVNTAADTRYLVCPVFPVVFETIGAVYAHLCAPGAHADRHEALARTQAKFIACDALLDVADWPGVHEFPDRVDWDTYADEIARVYGALMSGGDSNATTPVAAAFMRALEDATAAGAAGPWPVTRARAAESQARVRVNDPLSNGTASKPRSAYRRIRLAVWRAYTRWAAADPRGGDASGTSALVDLARRGELRVRSVSLRDVLQSPPGVLRTAQQLHAACSVQWWMLRLIDEVRVCRAAAATAATAAATATTAVAEVKGAHGCAWPTLLGAVLLPSVVALPRATPAAQERFARVCEVVGCLASLRGAGADVDPGAQDILEALLGILCNADDAKDADDAAPAVTALIQRAVRVRTEMPADPSVQFGVCLRELHRDAGAMDRMRDGLALLRVSREALSAFLMALFFTQDASPALPPPTSAASLSGGGGDLLERECVRFGVVCVEK